MRHGNRSLISLSELGIVVAIQNRGHDDTAPLQRRAYRAFDRNLFKACCPLPVDQPRASHRSVSPFSFMGGEGGKGGGVESLDSGGRGRVPRRQER